MTELNIVVAGHLCLDLFPDLLNRKKPSAGELFVPGKLLNIGGMRICTGGAVSNTGIAMRLLGARVTVMAAVGDDFIGRTILDFMARRVPGGNINVRKGESSSYTIVIAPKNTDRIFLHHPGSNDSFCSADIDFDAVRKAQLFHLGYPPLMKRLYEDQGEELKNIYKTAKNLGVTTSLDFSLPDPDSPSGKVDWNKILKKVLPYVDIFLPSVEEAKCILDRRKFLELRRRARGRDLADLLNPRDVAALSERLLGYGARIVLLKCGRRGIYLRTASGKSIARMGRPIGDRWAERQLWEPSYHPKKFVSSAGAGDASIAGFLVALLKGESAERSLRYATMCGAMNVQALDAISGIRSWAETTRNIRSGWKKNKLKIRIPGWEFDPRNEVWYGPLDKKKR